jgi:protease-4
VGETKRMLEAAVRDRQVKGIVLRINSPGGEVTASDNIYHAVKKAAAKKPVLIYMDTVAASGGYYIACGGSHIMANETTITGSIGVIIQTLNYREGLGKLGLESVTFTSGKYKDTLSPSREMRPDEREMVQGMVDDMYHRFLGIVSEAREIPEETLKDGIADGRVFTGERAVEKGLVDETGYIEDAYGKIRTLAGAPKAKIVRYVRDVSFGNLLGLLGSRAVRQASQPQPSKLEIDVSDRILPRLEAGRLYLLPPYCVR